MDRSLFSIRRRNPDDNDRLFVLFNISNVMVVEDIGANFLMVIQSVPDLLFDSVGLCDSKDLWSVVKFGDSEHDPTTFGICERRVSFPHGTRHRPIATSALSLLQFNVVIFAQLRNRAEILKFQMAHTHIVSMGGGLLDCGLWIHREFAARH